ncbi:Asp23/Gls24 family envelope stress response protein [Corynebacterium sp. S7]
MSDQSFKINERVFEKIATAATNSVPGAVKQDAKLAGLAGRSLPRFVATIDRRANAVHFDAELAIAFPSPARAVVEEIRESISARVESLTGFSVARINVVIASFVADASGQRVTREDLRWHQTGIDARSIILPTFHVEYPTIQRRASLTPITLTRNTRVAHVQTPLPVRVRSYGFLDAVTPVALQPVRTPPPVQVTSPVSPATRAMQKVTVARAQPLKSVEVRPFPEVKVEVAARETPRSVTAPQPRSPIRPKVPEPTALKPITIQPFGGNR